MEALHLRAKPETIIKILKLVNKASQDGEEVEILDNTVFEKEQKMLFKALLEEKNGETFEHDKTWDNLLETFA